MSIEQPIKTDRTPEPKEDLVLFLKGLVTRVEKCEAVLELSGGIESETRRFGDPNGRWPQRELTGRMTIDMHLVLQMPEKTVAERDAAAKNTLPEGWAPMPCLPSEPASTSESALEDKDEDWEFAVRMEREPPEKSPEDILGEAK